MMPSIVLQRVRKVYPHRGNEVLALDGIDLEIPAGELLTLAGPSGSGKTTLLRLIAGLEELTAGGIFFDGVSMQGVPAHRRDLAMVLPGGALLPHLSARDNLAFGLKLRRVPGAEISRRISAAARSLGLQECLERRPHELSTGQRQRVALARALVRQARILLLDEPLANLDPAMRAELRTEIVRAKGQLDATLVYVTHDPAEALSLGERVLVLHNGKADQIAPPAALYARPATLFVARSIGAPPMNLLTGRIVSEGDQLLFAEDAGGARGLHWPLAPDTSKGLMPFLRRPVVLGFRPDEVTVRHEAGSFLWAEVVVERVEFVGSGLHLILKSAAHTLTVRVPTSTTIKENERCWLEIQPQAAHYFDPATGLRLN